MTTAEFVYWIAFYQYEPFGQEWAQTARTCAVVAASSGARGVDEKSFLPVERPETVEERNERIIASLRAWAMACGFEVNDGGGVSKSAARP